MYGASCCSELAKHYISFRVEEDHTQTHHDLVNSLSASRFEEPTSPPSPDPTALFFFGEYNRKSTNRIVIPRPFVHSIDVHSESKWLRGIGIDALRSHVLGISEHICENFRDPYETLVHLTQPERGHTSSERHAIIIIKCKVGKIFCFRIELPLRCECLQNDAVTLAITSAPISVKTPTDSDVRPADRGPGQGPSPACREIADLTESLEKFCASYPLTTPESVPNDEKTSLPFKLYNMMCNSKHQISPPPPYRVSRTALLSIAYDKLVMSKCFGGYASRIPGCGYRYCNVLTEIMNKYLRNSNVNDKYEVCKSYPATLYVPRDVTDDMLKESARFRSESRFPAITFVHPTTFGLLIRSSQPKVGMINSQSISDQKLLASYNNLRAQILHDYIRHLLEIKHQESERVNIKRDLMSDVVIVDSDGTCDQKKSEKSSISISIPSQYLYIVDARDWSSTIGNQYSGHGGGTENINVYIFAKLKYLGMRNIHGIRKSFAKTRDKCFEIQISNVVDRMFSNISNGNLSCLANGLVRERRKPSRAHERAQSALGQPVKNSEPVKPVNKHIDVMHTSPLSASAPLFDNLTRNALMEAMAEPEELVEGFCVVTKHDDVAQSMIGGHRAAPGPGAAPRVYTGLGPTPGMISVLGLDGEVNSCMHVQSAEGTPSSWRFGFGAQSQSATIGNLNKFHNYLFHDIEQAKSSSLIDESKEWLDDIMVRK